MHRDPNVNNFRLGGNGYLSRVVFTSTNSYTFPFIPQAKGCYIHLCAGGGAGGGSVATNTTQVSLGRGGMAGGYVILQVEQSKYNQYFQGMPFNMTVGAGGVGVNGGSGNPGGTTQIFDQNTFGTFVLWQTTGGTQGTVGPLTTPPSLQISEVTTSDFASFGSVSPDYVFKVQQNNDTANMSISTTVFTSGKGGGYMFPQFQPTGAGSLKPGTPIVNFSSHGNSSTGYGTGGGGSANGLNQPATKVGGSGSNGFIMIEFIG